MINPETGREINQFNWKILLISAVFAIISIWIIINFAIEVINWTQIPTLTKWIILLMGILFIYEKIIQRISSWLIKLFEGISEGKGMLQSIDGTIEQAKPEELEKELEKERLKTMEQIKKEEKVTQKNLIKKKTL